MPLDQVLEEKNGAEFVVDFVSSSCEPTLPHWEVDCSSNVN